MDDWTEAWRPGYDVTAFFGRSGLYDAMREGRGAGAASQACSRGPYHGLAFAAEYWPHSGKRSILSEDKPLKPRYLKLQCGRKHPTMRPPLLMNTVRRRARHQMLTPTATRYRAAMGIGWCSTCLEKRLDTICKALGLEHWLEDERYATGKSRYQHMQALTEGVDEALSKRVETSGAQSLTQQD